MYVEYIHVNVYVMLDGWLVKVKVVESIFFYILFFFVNKSYTCVDTSKDTNQCVIVPTNVFKYDKNVTTVTIINK